MRGRRELSKGNYFIERLDKTLGAIRTYQDATDLPRKLPNKASAIQRRKLNPDLDARVRAQLDYHDRKALQEYDHATSALTYNPDSPPVLLVDEPETHLALVRQFALLDELAALTRHPTKPLQVIMASHSPLVFSYPGTMDSMSGDAPLHFIDLSPEMTAERNTARQMFFDRFAR